MRKYFILILFVFLSALIALSNSTYAAQNTIVFQNYMVIGTLKVRQHSTGKTTSRFSVISAPIVYTSIAEDDAFTLTATTKTNKRTLLVGKDVFKRQRVDVVDSYLNPFQHFDVNIYYQQY